MAAGLKHRIIEAGFRAIAASRADLWLAPIARGRGLILMFHRVCERSPEPFQPNALLEVTPEHLDQTLALATRMGFEFVALDEVPARTADRSGPSFVAVTFDDGYRDNRDLAEPILARHGVPWTLFVTADYASGRGRLWWVELEEVIRRSDRLTLDDQDIPAGNTAEKYQAFSTVYAALRVGPEERLREVIGRWCEDVGIDTAALVRDLCLGWDELAQLARSPGLTLGAHTLTHPMLAKHDEATARREILESRDEIRSRLGVEPRHFAYPVGDPTSAGPREFRMTAEAGYETAVTTRPGHLFAGHADHLTALPRVSVNGLYQTESATRALLSGVPFLAWNCGRQLNVA